MEAKKALIVTEYYPPAPGPATARIAGFTRFLPEFGWTPLIVTPSRVRTAGLGPSLASTTPRAAPPATLPAGLPQSGARVLQAPSTLPAPVVKIFDRLFLAGTRLPPVCRPPMPDGGTVDWFWSALLAILRAARRERPDVIYATAPPVTGHFAAALAARWLRIPLVLDFRDLWRDNPGYVAPRAVAAFHRRCERWLLHAAARVVVNTPGAHRVLRARYADMPELPLKMWVIPNGFNPEDFDLVPSGGARRESRVAALGALAGEGVAASPSYRRADARHAARGMRPPTFQLCFVGKLYGDFGQNYWDEALAQRRGLQGWKPPHRSDRLPPALACLNPAGVLEALRDLLDSGWLLPDELRVTFIGNHGAGNARLAAELGLQEVVSFHGTVDAPSALEAAVAADALLLLSSGAAHVVPAKTYEYLAAGKPLLVIAPPGDLEQLLRKAGVDWFGAPPGDRDAIRTALAELVAFLRRGEPARTAGAECLSRYERRRQAGRLAHVLAEAYDRSSHGPAQDREGATGSPRRQPWRAPALRPAGEALTKQDQPARSLAESERVAELTEDSEAGRAP